MGGYTDNHLTGAGYIHVKEECEQHTPVTLDSCGP